MNRALQKLLCRFPSWVTELVRDCIEVVPTSRKVRCQRVDGSYDHETGKILLWNPSLTDEIGLFVVLAHEIGHKIYQEILSPHEIKSWLKICSKEYVEISLVESYPSPKVPEEQFCWLITVAACLRAFSNRMPKRVEQKRMEVMQTNPKGYSFVRAVFEKGRKSGKTRLKPQTSDIYHWQVEEFKKWFLSPDPLTKKTAH